MKISNSKKQLAQIIHENGGWRDGAKWVTSDRDGFLSFFAGAARPTRDGGSWSEHGDCEYTCGRHAPRGCVTNWHQTILSRDEYFHLYPAPDADVVSLSSVLGLVTDQNKHEHVDSKPTIEQLAADYRNRKGYADCKQQEADAAKADADAKLAELVAAGKALGLGLSVAVVEPEKPAKPYTGRFYTDCTDERNYQTLCDGCGKRYGLHYGDRCEPGSEG